LVAFSCSGDSLSPQMGNVFHLLQAAGMLQLEQARYCPCMSFA
jgi:hypothetical protein